jgi:TPR repeat protein
MYATGDGVPQDDVRAYLWFTLAVAHSTGNKQKSAATNRDGALTRRMTPVQIAEAQKLAREWKPKGK